MYKRIVLLGIAFSLLVSCAKPPTDHPTLAFESPTPSITDKEEIDLQYPMDLVISLGETMDFPGEGLEIKFLEVVEDSRCPTGAECFWAGRFQGLFRVIFDGEEIEGILTLGEQFEEEQDYVKNSGLTVFLEDVTPHPALDNPILLLEYSANLRLQISSP